MDTRSLRYAITLAEELHFGRAAQRHYISPQPFGRHIQGLERDLGVRLFDRTSRRVTLTPAGTRVLAEARAILDAMDALTDPGRWATERDDGGLTIGALGNLLDRVPALIATVARWLPGPAFDYRELSFADQYDAIRSHQVDVGLVPYPGPMDGLAFERVLTMPRSVVVPARSPYADADLLTLAEVEDAAWVPLDGTPRMDTWAGPQAEQVRRGGTGVRTPSAIPAAVATTGRLCLHVMAAADSSAHPGVRYVPLEDAPPARLAIATRDDDHRPAVAAFRSAAHLLTRRRPVQ